MSRPRKVERPYVKYSHPGPATTVSAIREGKIWAAALRPRSRAFSRFCGTKSRRAVSSSCSTRHSCKCLTSSGGTTDTWTSNTQTRFVSAKASTEIRRSPTKLSLSFVGSKSSRIYIDFPGSASIDEGSTCRQSHEIIHREICTEASDEFRILTRREAVPEPDRRQPKSADVAMTIGILTFDAIGAVGAVPVQPCIPAACQKPNTIARPANTLEGACEPRSKAGVLVQSLARALDECFCLGGDRVIRVTCGWFSQWSSAQFGFESRKPRPRSLATKKHSLRTDRPTPHFPPSCAFRAITYGRLSSTPDGRCRIPSEHELRPRGGCAHRQRL